MNKYVVVVMLGWGKEPMKEYEVCSNLSKEEVLEYYGDFFKEEDFQKLDKVGYADSYDHGWCGDWDDPDSRMFVLYTEEGYVKEQDKFKLIIEKIVKTELSNEQIEQLRKVFS